MNDELPDLIVFRPHPDLAVGVGPNLLPPAIAGRWFDLRSLSRRGFLEPGKIHATGFLVAAPTGRFEVNADGDVAEVWEVTPPG